MNGTTPVIEAIGVSKSYGGSDGSTEVLRNLSLNVASGETVAIVGPSGSGKSTLLHILGTLDRPSAGRVLFEGRDLAGLSEAQLAELRARRIGFVFQAHGLLPQCTALENVLVPSLPLGRSAGAIDRARRLLDRVGLSARLSHRPGQLSGGECQRVAVVRALINAPCILLADEPTGSLDRAAAGALGDLLTELNREERVALLVVTHSEDLAARLSRLEELRDGKLSRRKGGG